MVNGREYKSSINGMRQYLDGNISKVNLAKAHIETQSHCHFILVFVLCESNIACLLSCLHGNFRLCDFHLGTSVLLQLRGYFWDSLGLLPKEPQSASWLLDLGR